MSTSKSKTNDAARRLNDIVDKVGNSLLNILIYSDDNGQYVLFDKYFISKKNNYFELFRARDEKFLQFNFVRNAIAWAILDNKCKVSEANRILELDQKIGSLKAEILVHKKPKSRESEISRDKLSNVLSKQKKFQWELDKYIMMAKQCQERGFKNELTRTSSK